MEHRYARVTMFSLVVLGCMCLYGVSGAADPGGHPRSGEALVAQRSAAGYGDRIRPPLRPGTALNQRQFLSRSTVLHKVDSRDVTGNVERLSMVPRFSHQQGPPVSSSEAQAPATVDSPRKKQYLQVYAEERNVDVDSAGYRQQRPGSAALYLRRPSSQVPQARSSVAYGSEQNDGQGKTQAGSEVSRSSSENYLGGDGAAGLIPEYATAYSPSSHEDTQDPGSLGHSLIQKAFDENFFSSEGEAGNQPNEGNKIDPVVAAFYETGVRPNRTETLSSKSSKKSKNKSDSREDAYDYVEAFTVDDPSSSGTGYGHNDLDLNPALFLPPVAPAPKLYPRPAPAQPDYVYKFKFYPAVGYHPGAKIIYLDDHDYYHPYYTPGGYESLKTVKKSVSKIQKELKKATKFQPHYDHMYGKGRVKQYYIAKPPPNWGPPPSYGHAKRPYHVPHPVTAFHGVGHIDDYLSYGDNIDFDRDGKDVDDE